MPGRAGARHAIFTQDETLASCILRYSDGAGDFGKPGNYFTRQIDRWTKQYRASETKRIPSSKNSIAVAAEKYADR